MFIYNKIGLSTHLAHFSFCFFLSAVVMFPFFFFPFSNQFHFIFYYVLATEIPPIRVADRDRPACLKCHSKFTALPPFQKRHHCRSCGDVFCNKCSTLRLSISLPGEEYQKGPVRVCDFCAKHLSVGDQNSMLRYCTILRSSPSDCGVVYKLQAARALHMSIDHLTVSHVRINLYFIDPFMLLFCF